MASNTCRACGKSGNGYSYTEEEWIVNKDKKRVKIRTKYWKCLSCNASTFINSYQVG